MTPERHARIGQVYLAALDQPPDRRASFLARECHGDPALQQEVESLLHYETVEEAAIDATALTVVGHAMAVHHSPAWAGQQVSHYQVDTLLGRGGMGEVYRARDVRLGRDVAVKVLPVTFAADRTRLRWFEQEARAAGQLNHPNVLTIYDVGVHDGCPFIVTELLEGEELRQILSRGPLIPRVALEYAQQIARGLAATHAKGIVHRDLKPENVFVTSDGRVKLLDFGLAKLTAGWRADGSSATNGARAQTAPGVVMATIGYASPEQLRGDDADHRTDIFAFGAVLYEMVTGRPPFARESSAEVMAAILKEEPAALVDVVPAAPPVLGKIVERCLAKAPAARFQSADDLAVALEALSSSWSVQPDPRAGASRVTRTPRTLAIGRAFTWLLVSLLGAAIGIVMTRTFGATDTAPSEPVARLVLPIEAAPIVLWNLEVSPDGAHVAYVTSRSGANTLYLRNLAADASVVVASVDSGTYPFFSPDSQWLGFFDNGKMRKVSVHGGTPITLADAPSARHATWGTDDTIVFAPLGRAGLFSVSANGGTAVPLTNPDVALRETSHVHPHWLPGGNAFLYIARGETQTERTLMSYSLADRTSRRLLDADAQPRYLATGHLLYLHRGTLMAVRFDPVLLEVHGTPLPVIADIAAYGVSAAGSLIYARLPASTARALQLVWVDRDGTARPVANAPRRGYLTPRIAPAGTHLAMAIQESNDTNIWTFDMARNALARFTFEGRNLWPVWSHDGRHIIYASNRLGTSWDLFWKKADNSAREERLLAAPDLQIPHSISRTGDVVGVSEYSATGFGVSVFSTGDRRLRPLRQNVWSPSLSPDGRWVTYVSAESGRNQIYVRPTSGEEARWQISTDGGTEPLWAAGGREIYYRNGDQMLVVPVDTAGGFVHGPPAELFRGAYDLNNQEDVANYDVTADGKRFLMLRNEAEPTANELAVVINWHRELQRLVPSPD